jgi:hypothetical protein
MPINSLIEAGNCAVKSLEVSRNGRVLVKGAQKIVREPAAREVGSQLGIYSIGASDSRDKGAS